MIAKKFDLTNLTLQEGTYDITVKAKGAGLESSSEVVKYTETRDPYPGTDGLAYQIKTTSKGVHYAICTGIGTATETDIVIGNTYKGLPVREIASEAFLGANITSVAISNGIKHIYPKAFAYCRNTLSSVTIPDSVKSIGDYAFQDCESLTRVDIGNGVTSIGYGAFSGCSSLGSSLESITIPDSVTKIGSFAFAYSGLTSITIPDSVKSIGAAVFTGCSNLSNVTLNEGGLTYIPRKMFSGCTSLESIELPSGVTDIGDFAFKDCTNLKSFVSNSIRHVGKGAFMYCPDDLFTETSSIRYLRIGGSQYYVLLEAIDKTKESYYIQPSTQIIADGAFEGCGNMTSITIPRIIDVIGKNAFKDCTNVTSITYIGSSSNWGNVELGQHFDYGVPVISVYCEGDDTYVELHNETMYISGTIKFNETMERYYAGEDTLDISLKYTHEYRTESERECIGIRFTGWWMWFRGKGDLLMTSILAYKFDDNVWTQGIYRIIKIDEPQAVPIKFYEWLERNATFLDEEE